MRRAPVILLAAGAMLLALGLFLSLYAGATAMPSYLADWLFWSSLPLGALPVVMLIDLAGPRAGFALDPALRRLLILTPVAAVLMIPLLLRPAALFGWANGHGFSTPFGQSWMTHGGFISRSICYGVLWTVLALLFLWPPSLGAIERRRRLAAIGLFAFAISATMASVDLAMTVEPNWMSAEFGLLLISAEVTIAVSFAILLADAGWRLAAPDATAAFLLGALAIWIFIQFIQFLVIWSGNKPSDIAWYLHRSDTGSQIVAWVDFVGGVVLPMAVLLPSGLRRHPMVLPAAAVLVIVTQALGMLWLITPSLRHQFTISGMDVLELFGLGGIMLGVCLIAGPVFKPEGARHV